jgi:hypothetical protein
MPKLELKIPHALSKQDALTRIQRVLPELVTLHSDKISDLEESWSGNTGSFKFKLSGFKVSGTVVVEDSVVIITGDIPFLALPFKSQIENTIRQQAEALLK